MGALVSSPFEMMDHLDNMGNILEKWRLEENIQEGSFTDVLTVQSSFERCTLHEKGDPSKPKNFFELQQGANETLLLLANQHRLREQMLQGRMSPVLMDGTRFMKRARTPADGQAADDPLATASSTAATPPQHRRSVSTPSLAPQMAPENLFGEKMKRSRSAQCLSLPQLNATSHLPDVVLRFAFNFLGSDIIRVNNICRRWRSVSLKGVDHLEHVPSRILEAHERNNPLVIPGLPYYHGRIVKRNDLIASWRSVSPSKLLSWNSLPAKARRWILTHASLHDIFAGPELPESQFLELISARFTSSMLPDQLSAVQSGRHYFFQALMQEQLQLEMYGHFSSFNTLLPVTPISLSFQVPLVVVDPTRHGGVARPVVHRGFNLPALVFANYNFSAQGAGSRARMQYFADLAGDEDSMDWFHEVPEPISNRQLSCKVADFRQRWDAIREVDVYAMSEDPFEEDEDFEFYEDRLVRVFWRGRFIVCLWFRLGFCPKADFAGTNVNPGAEEVLNTVLGSQDWCRYPQYNEMYKRERISKLLKGPSRDSGRVVGRMVVFGGMARDMYNNDDFNISFGCGNRIVVLPLAASDYEAFLKDAATVGGAKAEVYETSRCLCTDDKDRLQGYDAQNIEQMTFNLQL